MKGDSTSQVLYPDKRVTSPTTTTVTLVKFNTTRVTSGIISIYLFTAGTCQERNHCIDRGMGILTTSEH